MFEPARAARAPLFALLVAACATAQPVLPPSVQEPLAERDMRRLETEEVVLYYPDGSRDVALRTATRLEHCIAELRKLTRIRNRFATRKPVFLLPDAPFNNAFVVPPVAGLGPVSVVPTHDTLDLVPAFGLPPDPAVTACHEVVHYLHMLQVRGFWNIIATAFGDLFTPQLGFEGWFTEGLATYYESALQPGVGRMQWPGWNGLFHAAYAGGPIRGGDLNGMMRPFPGGHHYLVGSHFVAFLAERYGEDKLWALVASQGASVASLFLVSLRFRGVYGVTLTGLLEQFSDYVATRYPVRERPPAQTVIRELGLDARYAVAASGAEAWIGSDGDEPPRLVVTDSGGNIIRERSLIDVLPLRRLAIASPVLVSGLSFTADGSELYFVALDRGRVQDEARLLRYRVRDDDLSVIADDIGGPGGSVSADGRYYYFGRARGDRHDIAVRDLESGEVRMVRGATPQVYLRTPRVSPSGKRLAVAVLAGGRYSIDIHDLASGDVVDRIEADGPVHDPRFVDDRRLLYVGVVDGRFQVRLRDLAQRRDRTLTDAPYLVHNPNPRNQRVRFLNREGWAWSVDEVALPPPAPPTGTRLSSPIEVVAKRPAAPPHRVRSAAPGADPPRSPFRARSSARVLADEPYSATDRLFVPNVHAFAIITDTPLLGVSLGGHDRLQFHRWALLGVIDPRSGRPGVAFEYLNSQLPHYRIALTGSHLRWEDRFEVGPDMTVKLPRTRSLGSLLISRTFRTTGFAVGGLVVDDRRQDDPAAPRAVRRLGGPTLALSYFGVEATPFSGVRRGLVLSAQGTHFPEAWSTLSTDVTDVAAEALAVLPVPGWRHTLSLRLRARALLGARGSGLLQVGGDDVLISLFSDSNEPDAPPFDDSALPPEFDFFEPLRGFEEFALTRDRIAIAGATDRLPIRIDYGWSSLFWLLPSYLLRQVDLELFIEGAADEFDRDRLHAAAGGSVTVLTALFERPIDFRYQLAHRLTDDRAWVHSVAMSFFFEAQPLARR